jgi:prevent-host-death family protein
MTRRISALTARTQLGQIMNRAVENSDRFLVERNGEPAVLILSVADYVKTFAPPPDWLEKSWDSAKRHGLDKLTVKQIDTEIAASRLTRRSRKAVPEPGSKPPSGR